MVKVVFVTCPPEKAGDIANHLLTHRVCACVSVVPAVQSRYWWEGRLESAEESLLIVKCASEQVAAVVDRVKEVHPYEVPEVIAILATDGNPEYLNWVKSAGRAGAEAARKAPPFAEKQAAAPPAAPAAPAAPARAPAKSAPGSTTTAVGVAAAPDPLRQRVGKLKVILLGPPGVGKGTQAKYLAKRYGMRHISTGDLFLKAVRSGSDLGKEVSQFTTSGKLVPDRTTNIIVRKELSEHREVGYVLDGFPRTLAQAEALAQTENIDFVFYINAPQEVLMERLTKRFYCDCGDSYGPDRSPAVAGLCDSCGGMLYQREDDKAKNVLNRLEEYNSKTRELLRFYRAKLHPIDGSDAPAEVSAQISACLEK